MEPEIENLGLPQSDDVGLQTLVEGFVAGINDLACVFAEHKAFARCQDKELARGFADRVRMSDSARVMITTGSVAVLKKYMPEWQASPEATLATGLAIWAAGALAQFRMLPERPAPAQDPQAQGPA